MRCMKPMHGSLVSICFPYSSLSIVHYLKLGYMMLPLTNYVSYSLSRQFLAILEGFCKLLDSEKINTNDKSIIRITRIGNILATTVESNILESLISRLGRYKIILFDFKFWFHILIERVLYQSLLKLWPHFQSCKCFLF
jgi:hypothetical protein